MVADNSSQAEVGGATAILVRDDSVEGMAEQLTEALADRQALLERGRESRERAGELSWAATARGTTDAWREALGLHR
jgi:glycosyltransferase involved in cell wall biosynthesis